MGRTLTKCHAIRENGVRCAKKTYDSSGYCPVHRKTINKYTEFALLKCNDCPVTDCGYRDAGPSGLCYFEITSDVKDFDEKWKVLQAMRDVLRTEYMIIGRIEREMSRRKLSKMGTENDPTLDLIRQLGYWTSSIAQHLEKFGKFMGFDTQVSEEDVKDTKRKHMMKVMKRDAKDKENEKELQDNIPVEVVK